MDNLEYIDSYFGEELSPERKREFEEKIITDPVFAGEVAFYLSARDGAAAEMRNEREKFKGLYEKYKQHSHPDRQESSHLRKLWPWAAAAAVLAAVLFGWNVWLKPVSPQSLVDKYAMENFQTLSVTMGNKQDSLQAGIVLYNEGRQEEALRQFESLALNDTSLWNAKKYAGIVSLRLGQYDKAINYFSQLENNSHLYANPGKFYHALTLIKRNRPGDKQAARVLLEQVVQNDLEEKVTAQDWLKKKW